MTSWHIPSRTSAETFSTAYMKRTTGFRKIHHSVMALAHYHTLKPTRFALLCGDFEVAVDDTNKYVSSSSIPCVHF